MSLYHKFYHTSPIEPMLKKSVISNDNVTVLKARGKHTLPDVNCYCKLTPGVVLDGVTLFLRLKDITNTCESMRHSPTIGGNSSVQWRNLKEAEDFKCVFIVYCVLESK